MSLIVNVKSTFFTLAWVKATKKRGKAQPGYTSHKGILSQKGWLVNTYFFTYVDFLSWLVEEFVMSCFTLSEDFLLKIMEGKALDRKSTLILGVSLFCSRHNFYLTKVTYFLHLGRT